MARGQQLIAPNGCGTLKKDIIYHVLLRDDQRNRMVLVGFTAMPQNAWLEYIQCQVYEKALLKGTIKFLDQDAMRRMPPWLSTYENKHVEEELAILYANGLTKPRNPKDTSSEDEEKPFGPKAIVDDRQSKIRHVIENYEQIFKALLPEVELNRCARNAQPRLKEKRLRLWVLTTLAFPGNPWVILPPPGNRGKYPRAEVGRRVGRPRLDGSESGYNVTKDMKSKIEAGFIKFKAKGSTLHDIYADTLRHFFKCQERKGAHGLPESYHPAGEAFPSEGQFVYWCYKLFSKETVLRTLLGDIEYQNKHMAPIGSYSEGTQDLMQTAYTDVSHSKQHPRSVLSGVTLPKLAIAKVVCGLSGMIAGVAAGFGGETSSLYRQALFVSGIKKSKLGQILGMQIDDADWPCDLLPMNLHSDQGPGGAIDIRKIHADLEISHSLSPAYNPQKNSPVEAKHDKSRKLAGRPDYTVSADSSLKMYRAAIRSAINKNQTTNAIRRASPDQLSRNTNTPHAIYVDYRRRGRVAGLTLHFDELVKSYLPKIKLKVKDGFVTYKSVRYRSNELSKTDFAKNIKSFEGAQIVGYCLEICTRMIWIVINGRLVEVTAINQVIAAKDANEMTLYEHHLHNVNAGIAESLLKSARTAGKNIAARQTEIDNDTTSSRGRKTEGQAKVRKPTVKAEVAAMVP